MAPTDTVLPWADLPKELWGAIGRRLDSHMDVLRFRSVCSTWRFLLPPSLSAAPRLPLSIPFPVRSHTESVSIFQSTVYRLHPSLDNPSSSSSSSGWLIKIKSEESDPKSESESEPNPEDQPQESNSESESTMQLLNPLTDRRIRYKSGTFPNRLNLLNFRVTEICKEYKLRHGGGSPVHGVQKVLLSSNSPWTNVEDCIVVGISFGKLGFWKHGCEIWTVIDGENLPRYDDIILYRGQFYAVDRWGTVSWIDDSTMRAVQFSPPMCGGGDRKHLVEFNGDLYVVDQYYEGGRPGFPHRANDLEKEVDFKVYRLDQEWGRWEEVRSLGDAVFFLAMSSSFAVSVREFAGCYGNCIFYGEELRYPKPTDRANVFNLADQSVKRMAYVPAYLQIIWPPPDWVTSAPCALDPNNVLQPF